MSSYIEKTLEPLAIEVEARNVFGKILVYPVNDNAKLLANIAGTKTLSVANLANAASLGLNIVEVTTKKIDTAVVTPGYGGESW